MLNTLKPAFGSNKRNKRKGCGPGSGHGKTSCRGEKGQGSRSGVSFRPGFEGGQMPLFRKIGKRGFTNIFAKDFAVVNLSTLAKFSAGSKITPAILLEKGCIAQLGVNGVKVLGDGEIGHAITIVANAVSASAREAITKAGGTIELIAKPAPKQKFMKKGATAPSKPGASRKTAKQAKAKAKAAK